MITLFRNWLRRRRQPAPRVARIYIDFNRQKDRVDVTYVPRGFIADMRRRADDE